MTSDGSAVLGLSTRLLPGTLASKFQQAGEVGFDALCLDQAELEGGRPEDLAALIERFGVPVQALEASFSLEDLHAGDDGAALKTDALREAFATCAVLDIPVLVLPTGRTGTEPDWAALAALAHVLIFYSLDICYRIAPAANFAYTKFVYRLCARPTHALPALYFHIENTFVSER